MPTDDKLVVDDASALRKLATELAEEANDCMNDAPKFPRFMAEFLSDAANTLRAVADRMKP